MELGKRSAALALLAVLTVGAVTACGAVQTPAQKEDAVLSAAVQETDSAVLAAASEPAVQGEAYEYRPQSAGYDALTTDGERALYAAIAENIDRISDTASENGYYPMEQITQWGELSDAEIEIAIGAFKHDHPQVFWIANVYGRGRDGGSTILQLYSYIDAETKRTKQQELETATAEWLREIPTGLSELEREVQVYKHLAERCRYDQKEDGGTHDWTAYTVYGAMLEGRAVCEGYARCMEWLLSNLGMDCRLVAGTADGGGHLWNLVQVDGAWYHLDATWNDQQEIPLYDYFNVTDAQILQTHTIAPQMDESTIASISAETQEVEQYNFPLPACTETKANYLRAYGIPIAGFAPHQDQAVIVAALEAVKSGEPVLYFHIEESIDFAMAVSQIFQTEDPHIRIYIDGINERMELVQLQNTSVQYTTNPVTRSISWVLAYQ